MGQKSEHGSRTHARVKAATSAVFTCTVRDSLSASWSSSWGNGAAASRSIPRVDSSSGWGARWLFDARGLFTHYRQGGRPFRGRVGLLRMGAEQRDGIGPFGRGGSTTVAADWLATTRGRLTNQCQGDEPRLSASGRNAPPSPPQDGVVRCATTKRQHQGKPWTVFWQRVQHECDSASFCAVCHAAERQRRLASLLQRKWEGTWYEWLRAQVTSTAMLLHHKSCTRDRVWRALCVSPCLPGQRPGWLPTAWGKGSWPIGLLFYTP